MNWGSSDVLTMWSFYTKKRAFATARTPTSMMERPMRPFSLGQGPYGAIYTRYAPSLYGAIYTRYAPLLYGAIYTRYAPLWDNLYTRPMSSVRP